MGKKNSKIIWILIIVIIYLLIKDNLYSDTEHGSDTKHGSDQNKESFPDSVPEYGFAPMKINNKYWYYDSVGYPNKIKNIFLQFKVLIVKK